MWPAVIAALLEAGASDAWLTPILMKKGRPAHTLSALVDAGRAAAVRGAIFRQTSTIGLREQPLTKHALEREILGVEVGGQHVDVKLARHDGVVVNAQPEYDDVARAAAALGRPVNDVLTEATALSRVFLSRRRLMDPVVIGLTFLAIFVVELPDKTFLATLVLATKYRPILVWLGVSLAFLVQTTVAVLLGHAVSFLPEDLVKAAAALLFVTGAVILIREGRGHQEAAAGDDDIVTKPVHGWRAVLASFLVLFAAEWGDLSQLLTISLVAKYEQPVAVFLGALGALLLVSGLAVAVGRQLQRYVKLHVLHYIGAGVCLLLAAITTYELLG